MKTYLTWGLLVVVPCYVLDQVVKFAILSHLKIGEGFTVIPGFFDIIHVRNTGAAFGILRGLPETYRTLFFFCITVLACVAIVLIFRSDKESSWFFKLVLSLILAGAIGNLTDRLILKEVVDFLHVHVGRYHWPTFNLADSYISLGMVGLIIHTLFFSKLEGRKQERDGSG